MRSRSPALVLGRELVGVHLPRDGDGQSDVFRCRADGTGIEPLVTGPSMDDAGVLSPDGSHLAFVSTHLRDSLWEDSMPLYIPAKFL